jgi:predicted acylesterase/phospholipase RssA
MAVNVGDNASAALSLSGGGCFGAYQVGVIQALLGGRSPATDYQPLNPQVILGTSIGALNAALLLSTRELNLANAVDYVEHTWIDDISSTGPSGNGLLRFRGNPAHFLRPPMANEGVFEPIVQLGKDALVSARDWFHRGLKFLDDGEDLEQRFLELFDIGSLVSVEPFVRLIKDRVFPELMRRSGRKIRIPATNWRTGELRIFTEEEMTPEIGRLAVQASTALPGIFPPVEIQGEPYADGGLHMNTPLEPAIAAGANVIHAVHMDPNVSSIALPRMRNTFSSIYRLAVIAWAGVVDRDIETVSLLNRGLELLERGAKSGLEPGDVRSMLLALGGYNQNDANGYRKIAIHRYYPQSPRGETVRWLNFGRTQIERLIKRGFEDTLQHDCVRNQCVVPQINQSGESLTRQIRSLAGAISVSDPVKVTLQ